MASFIILFFAASCLNSIRGEVNVSEYVYWKTQDIAAWHHFFPMRVLEEERLTLENAMAAVQVLTSGQGLNDSLSSVVAFQTQELTTAQLLMQDTNAEGCVNGIADFMTDAVNDEVISYLDCAADAFNKLKRLNTTWNKVRRTYMAAYSRALNGIDACANTYPNKDSINRLKSCVDSMNNNYYAAANATQRALFPSPSMKYFQQSVVQCATSAAQTVASKGWEFLGMLVDCGKLTTTIDPMAYAAELNKWQGYNDTLQSQISSSQSKNYDQVSTVGTELGKYYSLQKRALEQYVIESRGYEFYLNKTYPLLSKYYKTVIATAMDNPRDITCADSAKAALDTVAADGASKALDCDIEIVNNTKNLIADVVNKSLYLNSLMPSIGNVALLHCFSQGYIFAPWTISECFDLVLSLFDVEHSDHRDSIQADVRVLDNYTDLFFNGTDLPCGGSSFRRLLLGGDTALYNLERCLYTGSGTTYSVTTPAPQPDVTTPNPPDVTTALYNTNSTNNLGYEYESGDSS